MPIYINDVILTYDDDGADDDGQDAREADEHGRNGPTLKTRRTSVAAVTLAEVSVVRVLTRTVGAEVDVLQALVYVDAQIRVTARHREALPGRTSVGEQRILISWILIT